MSFFVCIPELYLHGVIFESLRLDYYINNIYSFKLIKEHNKATYIPLEIIRTVFVEKINSFKYI